MKPLLRGWIHAVAAPVALAAVVVLACRRVGGRGGWRGVPHRLDRPAAVCTVAAFACQYAAVSLLVYQAAA